ncbi:hypothetical protein PCE1_002178 [Barthelona sp. PCE]
MTCEFILQSCPNCDNLLDNSKLLCFPLLECICRNLQDDTDFLQYEHMCEEPEMIQHRINLREHWKSKISELQALEPNKPLPMSISDVCVLLNRRITAGSADFLPPVSFCMCSLLSAALEPFNARGMTKIARSITKHNHRNGFQFWINLKGPVAKYNEDSELFLREFMRNIVWINWHFLPHEILCLELRQTQGYGMRWVVEDDKVVFRGCLEPPHSNGHESGWKNIVKGAE